MSCEFAVFGLLTFIMYLNFLGYFTLTAGGWFIMYLEIIYFFMFYYSIGFIVPLVMTNQGMQDIVIRLGSIRQDIQRVLNSRKVAYWEIDYLHENITVQKIV